MHRKAADFAISVKLRSCEALMHARAITAGPFSGGGGGAVVETGQRFYVIEEPRERK